MPDTPSRAAQLGAIAFLLRPTYIATEYVTAAATTGGYSFVSDSVSKLGEVGCSEGYCSPRHEVMNGSFMGYGVLLAGGALLLARPLGPWVTGLLVVSGVSSYATGLAPLDQDATLHALAATPLFVGAAARAARARAPAARGPAAAGEGAARDRPGDRCGRASASSSPGDDRAAGALERLALWPVLFGLGAFAWGQRPRRRG